MTPTTDSVPTRTVYEAAFLLGTSDRLEGRPADPQYAEIPDSDVSQGYLEGWAVGTFTDLRASLVEVLAPTQIDSSEGDNG